MFKRVRKALKSARSDYRQLEDRRMLAGNVRLAFLDGSVFMRGDNADNAVEAVRVFGDNNTSDLVVRGLEGTTINGQDEVMIPGNGISGFGAIATNGFRVNLGGGDDFMRFENVNTDGVTRFYGGPGDDSVGFYKSEFEDLTVQTFTGDDSVSLDRVAVYGQLRVFTLDGNDTFGSSVVRANQGFVLSTGEGNDRAAVRFGTLGRGMQVYTGAGDDFFGTQDISGDVNVYTGNGADQVSLFDTNFTGVVAGQGGDGDEFAVGGGVQSTNLRVAGFEGDLTFPNGKTQTVFNDQIRSGVALGTVSELLALDPRLSTASGAFSATGFADRFNDAYASLSQTVTVFAPTDAAFASLPSGFLDGLSTEELTDVLKFHIGVGTDRSLLPIDGLGATLSEADILAADEVLTILFGSTIDIEQTDDGVVLDADAKFVETNLRAKNGYVHVIDGVLIAD